MGVGATDFMQENSSPVSEDAKPTKRRCIVYVDGFNFYYGICRHRPAWKWFNFQSFFEALHRHEEIVFVRYFSASLDTLWHLGGACDRQMIYLKALRSLPKVKIQLGKFQGRDVTCRARCKEHYITPEEKKTDVNIAVKMMDDALNNRMDSLVLVTGDSDLESALFWIKQNYRDKKITVYVPCVPEEQNQRRIDSYNQAGISCRFLPLEEMRNHLLQNPIKIGGETLTRPATWV